MRAASAFHLSSDFGGYEEARHISISVLYILETWCSNTVCGCWQYGHMFFLFLRACIFIGSSATGGSTFPSLFSSYADPNPAGCSKTPVCSVPSPTSSPSSSNWSPRLTLSPSFFLGTLLTLTEHRHPRKHQRQWLIPFRYLKPFPILRSPGRHPCHQLKQKLSK